MTDPVAFTPVSYVDLAPGAAPGPGDTPIVAADLNAIETELASLRRALVVLQGSAVANNIVLTNVGDSVAGQPDGTLVFQWVPLTGGLYTFPAGPAGPTGGTGPVDTTGVHIYEWNGTSYVLTSGAKIYAGPAANTPSGLLATDVWLKE